MGDRWGDEGPPDEAYSRVTNPERFEPLHSFSERLIERLEHDFQTTREEGDEVDASFKRSELIRRSVRLRPDDPNAAAIMVAFSSFPGVLVRVGHWYEDSFPHCGCDACDETVEGSQEELRDLVDDVVSGRMRESLELAVIGDGWLAHERWAPGGSSRGRMRLSRRAAREMINAAGGKRRFSYSPWPRRN